MYLSDVERGRRGPLPTARILSAEAFLGIESGAGALFTSAARTRGTIDLPVKSDDPKEYFELLAFIAQHGNRIAAEDWRGALKVIEKDDRRNKRRLKKGTA